MAVITGASEADLFFEAAGLGPADWQVRSFRGFEAMSELFSFTIQLLSDADIVLDDVAGQDATLSWRTDEGETRKVHGMVASFEHVGLGVRTRYYEAVLVPRIWKLGLRRDCRIFLPDKTTTAILQEVLESAGFAQDTDFVIDAPSSATVREFCVQYRETDLDFLFRLMEEEGIYFYFKHDGTKDILFLADHKDATTPIEGEASISFRERAALVEESEAIYSFRRARHIRTAGVQLHDWDFKGPRSYTAMAGESGVDAESALSIFEYPAGFRGSDVTTRHSEALLGSMRAEANVARGESDCRRVVAGYRLTLTDFPRDDANGEYLITRVEHWGHQKPEGEEAGGSAEDEEPPYNNRFECIPSETVFRPPHVTPRPRIDGVQTAIVTGSGSEEIWPDEFGRIKVKFHWDRSGRTDDTSSCWLRVQQTWAGAGWGGVWIPRVGQEVLVEFLEGNPDRPICVGALYNGSHPTPYSLPDEKTKSTIQSNSSPGGGGSNEIRFEDAKGAEQVFVHAQLNMDTVVEADRSVRVGHDEIHEVGHDRSKKVKHDQELEVGNDQTCKVGNNDSVEVIANQDLKVGGNLTIRVGGNRDEAITGMSTISVASAHSLNVGLAMAVEIGGGLTEKVGANHESEVEGSSDRTVSGDDGLTVSGASNVSIAGAQTTEVGGALGVTVSGASTWETTDGLKVKAKTVEIEADNSITLKTGSASIELASDGTITLKGKEITVDGTGKITLKAPKTGID